MISADCVNRASLSLKGQGTSVCNWTSSHRTSTQSSWDTAGLGNYLKGLKNPQQTIGKQLLQQRYTPTWKDFFWINTVTSNLRVIVPVALSLGCFLTAQILWSERFILLGNLQNCAYWVELGSNIKTLPKNRTALLGPMDNSDELWVVLLVLPASNHYLYGRLEIF